MDTYTTCMSNNTHLSERAWGCSSSDKNMDAQGKSGHIISIFHKRREQCAFTVKKFDFDNPQSNQIDDILKMLLKIVMIKFSILSNIDVKMT